MVKHHEKRVRKTRRRTEGENTHRFTQSNTQKMPNWKIPKHDGIQRFWFKKFSSIHDRLAVVIYRWLQEADVHEWMTK